MPQPKINLILKVIFALSMLIVSSSAGYYYIYYLPQKQQADLDLQKQELELKEQQLKNAADEADEKKQIEAELRQQEENEKKRIEEEQRKKEEEENKKTEQEKFQAALMLEACLADAGSNYHANWIAACKIKADAAAAYNKSLANDYSGCISDETILENPYMGASWCQQIYKGHDLDAQYDPDCSLPGVNAEKLDQKFKDSREECYKRFPQK